MREGRNMTLEELAARSGLTPNYIGSVENGKRDPSLSTILALAQGLAMKPGELLGSVPNVSAAAEQMGHLFDDAGPELQAAVLMLLRAFAKKRRS